MQEYWITDRLTETEYWRTDRLTQTELFVVKQGCRGTVAPHPRGLDVD